MRVAAIDIGTNSIHLLIADVEAGGVLTIVEKAREQVELGRGGLSKNKLTPEAMKRGLTALESFKEAIDGLQVEAIHCAATSAVREASNGSQFCSMVGESTGIRVRTISGLDEARLIYLGARQDLDFGKGYALLLDLGGGSAEFILCDAAGVVEATSLPLGHIRLSEAFHKGDAITAEEVGALRKHVRQSLRPMLERIRPGSFGTLTGTSGAIRTLGRMANAARTGELPLHGHGLVLRREDVEELVNRITGTPQELLVEFPGMDSRRRATLPAAAAFLAETMKLLGAEEVLTSERSLRDGLLHDWVLKNEPQLALAKTVRWPRMRAVRHLMERFEADIPHAEKVRDLALELFDGLNDLHGLGSDARRELEFAALLHDIGHHIQGGGHNRHGQYLIRHSRMSGFTAPEVHLLGLLVRYHRGGKPKRSHPEFAALPKDQQQKVTWLSSILRVADGLDRSHNQCIEAIDVRLGPESVDLHAKSRTEPHLERWATHRRKALLESTAKRTINLLFDGTGGFEHKIR